MKIINTIKIKGRNFYIIETDFGLCKSYKPDYDRGHTNITIQAALDKNEFFKNKANQIHNNLYDYSLVDYQGFEKKVKIICKIHGIFEQTPHNHFKGNNCTKCARIASSNNRITYVNGVGNAIVYCLEIFEDDGSKFYKIGFTKHSIKYRYTNFYTSKMPYSDYNILWEKVLPEKEASKLENNYHKILGKYHYIPKISFAGAKTECFKILK